MLPLVWHAGCCTNPVRLGADLGAAFGSLSNICDPSQAGRSPLTPIAALEAALAADLQYADPAIWISRVPSPELRERAEALQAKGPQGRPLWGMTFAVKDNIDVAGLTTTAACPDYAYAPTVSAPSVQRLLDAGALLLGKTNLDQFATGLVGVRSPYGTPRNVFDASRVPGGSSSGSGVAVAAGIVDFALGTDTAGSGRVPAAFGNIVGLKPTIGSVSATGMVPACRSIDSISVFARSVGEALAVQRVIVGYDAADPYSRTAPFSHLVAGAMPANIRIGIADIAGLCDPEVTRLYAQTASLFPTELVDIGPFLAIARLLYDGPWVAERTAALRDVIENRPEIVHPTVRDILQAGFARSTVDAFDAFHALAKARRLATEMFAGIDALLLPTVPFCPTLAELAADPIGPNSRLGTFTNFVNLCDLAAIAVPAGMGADGLPVGVTLIGPAWSEGRLAPLAEHIHQSWVPGLSSITASDIAASETALFCIGAHMSGLGLNGQVTALGGRFLREARTTAAYRLYAMGNRPGMLRAVNGAAIPGEVWALPTSAIGALLAQVPAPLGFGSVELEDGPCLGFLAEAAGVAGMPDITEYDGWRGWLAAGKPA
jgi:allophanate hydrolase